MYGSKNATEKDVPHVMRGAIKTPEAKKMKQQRAAREACDYGETTVRQALSYGYPSVILRLSIG